MLLLTVSLLPFILCGIREVDSRQNRIVGGEDADLANYPFIASIGTNEKRHICGGSLIDSRYVLTAAHCFKNIVAANLRVHVGSRALSTGSKVFGVYNIIMHPEYNETLFTNDIAILELVMGTRETNVAIYESCLDDDIYNVTAIGWGYKNTNDTEFSDILQQAHLQTAYSSYCKSIWNEKYTNNTICTLYPGKGPCKGDSGGPLLYKGKLIGVSSFGPNSGCASIYADVFTNVCKYKDWIESNKVQAEYL